MSNVQNKAEVIKDHKEFVGVKFTALNYVKPAI